MPDAQRAEAVPPTRRQRLPTVPRCYTSCHPGHGLPELHDDADDGQDRVLRSGPVREDHEPALDPQPHGAVLTRRDGEPRDRGRPHALLRPATPRRRDDRGDEGPAAALHRAGPGLLQRHPSPGAEGRRRRRFRGRQPAARPRAERGVAHEPPAEPRGAGDRAARRADRLSVQQARPAQHPARREAAGRAQPAGRARVRGGGHPRRRRLRDAEGGLAARARHRADEARAGARPRRRPGPRPDAPGRGGRRCHGGRPRRAAGRDSRAVRPRRARAVVCTRGSRPAAG